MNHPFVSLWEKPSRLVVGLMSGTSADGVDAVLTRISGFGLDTGMEQLSFYFQPFDAETRQRILQVCAGDFGGSRELCLLSTHLGKLYAQAVRQLLKQAGIVKDDKRGTTVYYQLRCPCILNFFGCIETVIQTTMQERSRLLTR